MTVDPNAGLPPKAFGNPTVPTVPNASSDFTPTSPYTIDINPNAPPDQKTLVYSPDVKILIARNNKEYDVSSDIVSGSIQRNENAVSTLVFKLSNKDRRYNKMFERMDRVIVLMKRVSWIQVFSGYLDRVPHVQLYPGTVNFVASCTLKRIVHTWWDAGLPASTHLFDQAGLFNKVDEANPGETMDAGLGSALRRFLVEVGGWSPQNIHIQRFPHTYYMFMEDQLKKSQKGIEENARQFKRMMLGDDISLGTWAPAGRDVGVGGGGISAGSYTLAGPPDRQLEVIRTVDSMGMGPDTMIINASQGLGDAATKSADYKDQPAWKESQTVSKNWEEAGKTSDAAIHCFMVVAVEAPGFVMYANNAVPESLNFPHDALSPDHTSVGIYQQSEGNGWGSVAQRMNVRESTQMFLQRLNGLNWKNMDRGTACQTVQGSAFPERYAQHEQESIQAVRTLRGNQTPGSGASPTTNPGSATIPGIGVPAPAVPGIAPGINNGAVTNGDRTPAGAASAATGRPRYDTQGAINYAKMQLGKPYIWGHAGPDSFDCSGLTMMAYKSIGIEMGHNTHVQYDYGQKIPAAQAKPGDLMFPNGIEHVVMVSDTPGMILEASTEGVPIHEVPNHYGVDVPCVHIGGTEWGGPGAAAFNPFPTGPGAAPGTVTNGPNGTSAQTSAKEPIARNLFTYMFIAPPGDQLSMMLGSQPGEEEKAFMNDASMMPTVKSFSLAGLRNFQSLPNGDFAAYYPDYFGLDGKRAILKLRDIEMKNVQIDLNDDALCTHAYVAGSQTPMTGGAQGMYGWINSRGFATVENEWLFKRMTMAAPSVQGERLTNGKDIMRRFGVRPLVQEMSMVQSGPMEFLCAVALFMQKWAEQYSTQVELTFMPELYPGMRVELDGHNLQVYVSNVTHNFDFENGFSTTATISAPSTTDIGKMITEIRDIFTQNNINLDTLISQASSWMP